MCYEQSSRQTEDGMCEEAISQPPTSRSSDNDYCAHLSASETVSNCAVEKTDKSCSIIA
jgi:hypothetical protein